MMHVSSLQQYDEERNKILGVPNNKLTCREREARALFDACRISSITTTCSNTTSHQQGREDVKKFQSAVLDLCERYRSEFLSMQPPCFGTALRSLFRASLEREEARYEKGQRMDDDDDEYGESYCELDESLLFAQLRTLGWLRPATASTVYHNNNDTGRGLGLLQRPLADAVHDAILGKVRTTISGDFESTGLYDQVQEWTGNVVWPWLRSLLLPPATTEEGNADATIAMIHNATHEEWSARLTQATATCFVKVRMEEIFNIVADYPDSHEAVVELRRVLGHTKQHAAVADALKANLIRRLNHPGANTHQIIDVYIATIKVLRILDDFNNNDRLLTLVAEPVRSYLRGRHDTVRCIITSLTDAKQGGDLYEELRRQNAKPLENVTIDSDDEDDEVPPSLQWQPPPSLHQKRGTFLDAAAMGLPRKQRSSSHASGGENDDAEPTNGSGGSGDGDILAMMVSIYGSKELFVNEYRVMLADKLLSNLDYNTDDEVHTLELLKLRFGELSMRNCEVMIKDMDDSKRANANIHSTLEAKRATTTASTGGTDSSDNHSNVNVVDVAMVSHIFWPTLQNDPLKHHPRIQAEVDAFSMAYAQLKNPRKLHWMNQLGTIELELDVVEELDEEEGDEEEVDHTLAALKDPQNEKNKKKTVVTTKTFTCSPLLATLISHFEDRTCWTADDLSNETGIPEHVIQKRMTYWINQRVVRLVKAPTSTVSASGGGGSSMMYEIVSRDHLFELEQDQSQMMMMGDGQDDGEDGGGGQTVSATAQEAEELEVYESYIVGMLTNMGQLPLERIHNMLKMFGNAGSDNDVKYNKTPQQLSACLLQLCRQEKLECGPDGMYKLFKK